MKKLSILTLFFALLFTHCSSGDDDYSTSEGSGSWTFGDYTYRSRNDISIAENDDTVTIVTSSGEDNASQDFSGSALIFSFTNKGSGTYEIVPYGDVATTLDDKVIEVSCTIGISTVNATRYETYTDTGAEAVVTYKDDGTYEVVIAEEVPLEKTTEVGTGVPNAENSYNLSVSGIN